MALFLIVLVAIVIIFIIFALKTGLFPYLKEQLAEAKRMAALKQKNYHANNDELKSVNIDLFHDNIIIRRGESFRITSNQPNLKCELDENGVLNLTSDNAEEQPSNILTEIVFPKTEDDHALNLIKIKLNKGSIDIDDLSAKDFDFNVIEGKVNIRKSSTSVRTDINVDKGNVEIESGVYNDLQVYVKDGIISTTCQCFGDNKFLVDMGSMTVRMNRPLKQYKIHIEAESGFVGFEGRRGTKFRTEGKPNTLECYIKIGNATLTYSEDDILSRIH